MSKSAKQTNSSANRLIWRSVIKSVIFGLLVSFFLILVFSFFLSRNDLSEGIPKVLSIIALSAGAFLAGILISKKHKKRGALLGVICGALIYFTVLAGGLIMSGFKLSNLLLIKLLVALLSGTIGGMIGVNIKKKPKI